MAGKPRDTPPKTRMGWNARARKVLKDAGLYHEGWDVHHIDHDYTNYNLDNLICIPRHIHMTVYHPEICARRHRLLEKNHEKTKKPVLCVETGVIYESASDAYRKTGVHFSHISRVCKGERMTAGKFHWKFHTKEECNHE